MHKVEDLIIWKKAIDLTKAIYLITSQLPQDEKYGLISQIKRCSISIPSNIAEGAGRNSQKEFKYFLSVTNGSSYELHTQLILMKELNLISNEKIKPLIELCIEIQKMNYAFQKIINFNTNYSIPNTQYSVLDTHYLILDKKWKQQQKTYYVAVNS